MAVVRCFGESGLRETKNGPKRVPRPVSAALGRELTVFRALSSVHAASAAPDRDCKRGPIDEGVAVALRLDDPLVPPALEAVDRVGLVPRQQGAEMPEQWAAAAVLVDQREVGHAVTAGIADVHVEQHPSDITLDRVARLEAVRVASGVALGMRERALGEIEVAAVRVAGDVGRAEVMDVNERELPLAWELVRLRPNVLAVSRIAVVVRLSTLLTLSGFGCDRPV